MRYVALATDGDGTLTEHGQIEPSVAAALCQFRNAGGRVFLATGETITDLAQFPHIDLFDRIVAENGAVLFSPNLGNERVLCDDDPQPVVRALREFGANGVKHGRVVVSVRDHRRRIEEALTRHNLAWKIVHNRKDFLIVPRGIDKASGLAAALPEFAIQPERVAAVGDAENDRSMLEFCGLGVAVANAVPLLKASVGMVTSSQSGHGVIELIDAILRDEL
jgi:hydroxymethylpyrimidine pyrophosphatase-like HAD family hydrolase